MSIKTKISREMSSEASAGVRYDAFAIRNYEQENEPRAEWSKIGVAFPHRDGQGFRLLLTAVPVDGQVVIRIRTPKAAD